jgi:hypothetical protein
LQSKLNGLFASLLVALTSSLVCPSLSAQSQIWQHPGVLVSQAQLDFVKQQVANKAQPFYQEYVKATKSDYGSLTYKPKGPYPGGINQCGSNSTPDNGCQDADDDSAAAYVQALLWYISGNKNYADNAIAIMNAYGSGFKGYAGFTTGYPCPGDAGTCSNGPLQAAWDATKWPRAAEIIRYGNNGGAKWTPSAITNFSSMLKNIYEPIIYNGSADNGNWELAMIEGMMGIAVFNEDLPLLQHAQLYWNQRVPAYFYDFAFDNTRYPGTHWPFPTRQPAENTTWNGQLIFAADTTGVAQETCRDLRHTEDGIASTINAAETDYIQSQGGYGVNLYTDTSIDAQNRLVTSLNLMAGLESANSTSAPPDFCTGSNDKIAVGVGTTYVIGYNEYHNRLHDPNMAEAPYGTTGLLGTENTSTWIQNGLLPQSLSSDQGVHMAIFEPLTHSANAPAPTPNFALSVTPGSQTISAGATASYTITVTPSNGYTGTVALSVASGLPTEATAVFNPSSISSGAGTSTLTISTTSSTPSGTDTLTLSGTDGTLTSTTIATLVVTSAATVVTITAKDQHMKPGATLPTFTAEIKPSSTQLTTPPTCTTTANSGSPIGTYPITCAGAAGAGDTFVYNSGILTIKK